MPRRRKRRRRPDPNAPPRSKALNNVKAIRTCNGLSQSELARASGVPVGTIQYMEQGQTRDPKMSTMIKLAKALGVRVGQLCGVERLMD